jgi:thiamine biosynthesis lipoprotein
MFKIDQIPALGTFWWFEFFDEISNDLALELKQSIVQEMESFEADFSRFRADSMLSKLNRERILENPSPEFIELLQIAQEFYQATNGYFNSSLGHILENRGYDSSYSFTNHNQSEEIPDFTTFCQFSDKEIKLIGEGKLDFGGFGKGFLIDKLAKNFESKYGIKHLLINGGGDILLKNANPEELILENAFNPGFMIGKIMLQNQALAVSSNQKRRWKDTKTQQEYAHILNPQKLDELVQTSAFVVAKTALISDICATMICLFADKPEQIQALQEKYRFEYAILNSDQKLQTSTGFPQVLL